MVLTASGGLLAATALHLGFQAVITGVTYPALVEVPPGGWTAAHDAHSRRTARVVAPVYAAAAIACARSLRSGAATPLVGLAVTATAAAALSTALVAAPTHGRLGREGPVPALLARLHRADVVRLAGALVAAGAALAAVLAEAPER